MEQRAPRRHLAARLGRISLIRNSMLMMGSTAANLLLGFVFVVVATRSFTVSEYGLGMAVISAMTLCSTVGSVGVGNVLIQFLPRRTAGEEWSRTLNAGLVLASGLGLLVGVPTVVLLPLLAGDLDAVRDPPLAAVAFLAGIGALAVSEMLDRAFVAERRTGGMLARNVVAAVLRIALLLAPPFRDGGAWGIAGAWILAAALTIPLAWVLARRLGRGYRLAFGGIAGEAVRLRHALTGNHLVSIGNMSPQFLLPLLVTGMLSAADNGVFSATWRVGAGFMVVSVAVSTTLLAEISHDGGALGRSVRRAGMVIAALLLPAIAVFLVIGRPLLELLGPAYAGGFGLLVLLMVGAIPDAVSNVYVAVLRHQQRFGTAMALTSGIAILLVGGSLLLLGPMGIEGVGVAWLVAQSAGCVAVAADVARQRRRAAAGVAAR